MTESVLQANLLLEAPKRLPNLRLFRRNVVKVRIEDRTVRAGIKGQCDLYGYVRGGRTIEVELKGVGKYLSPEQKAWQAWCEEWRVPHVVLRAARGETVEETVGRWCDEIRNVLSSVQSASDAPRTTL